MKITLDIPDDGRAFRVMKGRELIAFVEDGYLYEKTESCNYCGECCLSGAPFPDGEGRCIHLKQFGEIFECTNNLVPWECLNEDHREMPECCSIRYKKTRIS